MKLAAWNLNSVRAREERLLRFLREKQPDVLCLQELKVPEEGFPTLLVRDLGYHAAVLGQKTYNGVAIHYWEKTVLFHPEARRALEGVRAWGFEDAFRLHHQEAGVYSWWDYRQLAFPRNQGLRIDHVFLSAPLAARSTAASIDRDERKGKQPSDHVPVVVEL